MSFQTPITIKEAIDNIENSHYFLPAIQREFEWSSDKIEWIFDSLMQGYPISSFLFWSVEGESVSDYRFYKFLREYRERFKIHNETANVEGKNNFVAILDGQQRLTSLLIGLKGSYAFKEKHRHWDDNQWSIPTRRLYLNISEKLDGHEEEDGRIYRFAFLKDSDTQQADIHEETWFRVGKILDLKNFSVFSKYVRDNDFDEMAADILARLQEVIFTDRVINYFLEKDQDLHKALNIFIRINSGGQPLNFSDLIMSIAIANWENKNARDEIHALVDQVRSTGFSISKDLIFKTYLYLYSSDIRFKVTNFNAKNAHDFETNWEQIRDAIQAAFKLVASFGYTDFTLTSKNAVIPIIYYLYHRDIYRDFETKTKFKEDRDEILKWLQIVTIKRVFGGQSDGTLSQIRNAFSDDVSTDQKIKQGIEIFPARQINGHIKRDLSVGDEFIEELLETQKDDRYAFSILALLFPNLDYKNNDFHKDHLHPISSFAPKNIASLDIPESNLEFFTVPEWYNSIINLQMLDSNENMSKQDKSLQEWFEKETVDKDSDVLRDRCLIPSGVSLEFVDFKKFAKKREKLLAKLLKGKLGAG